MLQPKRVKHRKMHRARGDKSGVAHTGATVVYGEMALKAMECGEISARQIESARIAINRTVRRGGKTWIRIFPDRVLTMKAAQVPMGSGKGAPDKWVAQVHTGKVLFEMSGATPEMMKTALTRARFKLPISCSIVSKDTLY